MLTHFLVQHRPELIKRCKSKVAERASATFSTGQTFHGIPVFLEQVIHALELNRPALQSTQGARARAQVQQLQHSATQHGLELLQNGYTVEQVVRDYGDLCQSITELAVELDVSISVAEFKTLNLCLDDAIADAVTAFSKRREAAIQKKGNQEFNHKLGVLAHELRNHINTANLAVTAIKSGNVGLAGATARILDRSLVGLKSLIDQSLAEVRVSAGLPDRHRLLALSDLLEEAHFSASFEAKMCGCTLLSDRVDPTIAVDADEEMLLAALANLLQNGMKFSEPGTWVRLSAEIQGDRILIHVQDKCGGLPPGAQERMFAPFSQLGKDRSGIGLGLSISKQSVEANAGTLSVRDLPGSGCIFTVSLPRHTITPGATPG